MCRCGIGCQFVCLVWLQLDMLASVLEWRDIVLLGYERPGTRKQGVQTNS